MLHFDIDLYELQRLGDELNADHRQVRFALSRAMRRTEATLRRQSTKGLRQVLGLRAAGALRNRLKSIRLRNQGDGMGLWYGLNALPVSAFKGRPINTARGAAFRGVEHPGAFVGRSRFKGKNTILKRVRDSRLPVAEQLQPIEDKAIVFIEDEIFDKVLDVFWQHFQRDLSARTRFGVGRNQ